MLFNAAIYWPTTQCWRRAIARVVVNIIPALQRSVTGHRVSLVDTQEKPEDRPDVPLTQIRLETIDYTAARVDVNIGFCFAGAMHLTMHRNRWTGSYLVSASISYHP